jgi:hypothetical protein
MNISFLNIWTIKMCALKYLVLVMLPIAIGNPINNLCSSLTFGKIPTTAINKRDDRFQWGSVGDSWASGVSFDGEKTDYDGDKHGCHRWKDSYGPLYGTKYKLDHWYSKVRVWCL